jgi:hypothetical protein
MARIERTIETEFGPRMFSFTRMFTVTGVRFHVSVANVGNIYSFTMQERNGVWRIINPTTTTTPPRVPDWITTLEDNLSKQIIGFSKRLPGK